MSQNYTKKYINISGNLTINNSVIVFEDCIFNIANGSAIICNSTNSILRATLKINESKLFSCNGMWKGLQINRRSKLLLLHSHIEDAEIAVGANFQTDLTFDYPNKLFCNNIGISIPYSQTGKGTVHLRKFTNVIIDNPRPMNQAFDGSHVPFCGIKLTGVTGLNLIPFVDQDPLIIENLRNGIVSNNSNFNLKNALIRFCKFEGTNPIKGFGIHLSNSGNIVDIDGEKLINFPKVSFVNNEYKDIYSNGNCKLTINNVSISREGTNVGIANGILVENNNNNIFLTNNVMNFKNLHTNAGECVLIHLFNIGSDICEVKSNNLTAKFDLTNEVRNIYYGGIEMQTCIPATSESFKVMNNILNWTHTPAVHGGYPIYTSSFSERIEISNNIVNSVNNHYSCIGLHDCDKINVYNKNNLTKNPDPSSCLLHCSAIDVAALTNSRICDNITTGSDNALVMQLTNTMTSIGENEFKSHKKAIVYKFMPTVGKQLHTGNIFRGPFTDAIKMTTTGVVDDNQYFIDQTNYGKSVPYWPGFGSPPTFVIHQSIDEPNGCLPKLWNPNDTRFCSTIASFFDPVFIESRSNAQMWDIKNDLYNLLLDGYFQSCNFNSYFDLLSQTDIPDFVIIDRKISSINSITQSLNENIIGTQNLITQKLADLHNLNLYISTNNIEDPILEEQIEQLITEIDSDNETLSAYLLQAQEERDLKIIDAYNLIQLLPTNEVYKSAYKLIYNIILKKINNQILNENDNSELLSLSNKCFTDYGISVFRAKILTSILPDIEINLDNCNSSLKSYNNKKNYSIERSLNSVLELKLINPEADYISSVELFSITGSNIYYQNNIKSQVKHFDLSNIQPGIYFLKFINSKGEQFIDKIIK